MSQMDTNARDLRPACESHRPELGRLPHRLQILTGVDIIGMEENELQERFLALGENPSDMICELNRDLAFVYASQNFRQILHLRPSWLLGQSYVDLVHPDDQEAIMSELNHLLNSAGSTRLLFRMRNGEGEWRWIDSSAKAYCSSSGEGRAILISRDATERQRLEEYRVMLAARDATTVLYNKQFFVEQLVAAIEEAQAGNLSALIYIDLDNFKLVNDRCGHLAGDRLIVAIANLLHEATPANGILARFGGDEFVLLLKEVQGTDEAVHQAEILRGRLAGYHFIEGGHSYVVGASVGLTMVTGEANSREIIQQANAASSAAKRMGGNRVEVFQAEESKGQHPFASPTAVWADRLEDALRNDQFELWYQPVLNLRTQRFDHFDALIRLRQADGHVISPAPFLHAAERVGMLEKIDNYVLNRAVQYLAHRKTVKLGIILSSYFLGRDGAAEKIEVALSEADVSPGRLIVQIPWVALLTILDQVRDCTTRLRQTGVRIGIKNFRADFSSVRYLRDFPVDYLKLEPELMRDFVHSQLDQAMVSAVNQIGHALNAKTIAEFVDDNATLVRLKELGIDYAKGSYISHPTPEIPDCVSDK